MSRQFWHRLKIRLIRIYPPYLGAGVRVRVESWEPPVFEASVRLTWWNRNLLGTHFGGTLYSMCDPFFVIILYEALGEGVQVWDKAATVRFRRPGRGRVSARFAIPEEEVQRIRAEIDRGEVVEPTFTAEVRDASGEVVAEVEKLLWVRKRRKPE